MLSVNIPMMVKIINAEFTSFLHTVKEFFLGHEASYLSWEWRKEKEAFTEEGKMGKKMRTKHNVCWYFKILLLPDLVVFSLSTMYFFSEVLNTLENIFLISVFWTNL